MYILTAIYNALSETAVWNSPASRWPVIRWLIYVHYISP
jgi:hypothetical protein